MWINVTDQELALLRQHSELKPLVDKIEEMKRDVGNQAGAIGIARDTYALGSDDDLEIDDEPSVSITGGGVWVMAWVWVANDEENKEDDE